jgi:hypothetical protein
VTEISNPAFRRGVHAAVQAIVADFTGLVRRRIEAHSPELTTQTIVAMVKRIAESPYPTEDPGPADPATPEVPAEPRPTTEMLLAVACLAAEESGLPLTLTISSDGVLVQGKNAGRSSLRSVSWTQITQSDVPMLSLAVEAVLEELRA